MASVILPPRIMKCIVVAGARPNFVKVAPILLALRAAGHTAILVHTGQHHDDRLSGQLFRDLGLPTPDFSLEVGSGTHAVQTAAVMTGFEPVVELVRPHWIIVVGDVNSTLGCALVAAKLRPSIGVRLAHVEAGLRSGDWSMPEEVNRVVTDVLSDLLLTPSVDAAANLAREGVDAARVVFVGNVMIDSLRQVFSELDHSVREPADRSAVLVTIHRPSNTDDLARLTEILAALRELSAEFKVILPLHPRTSTAIRNARLEAQLSGLVVCEPMGYRQMVQAMNAAAVVITDSGGVQEETSVLGVPCVTVRETTERPITVTEGTNRLAEWPLTREGIVRAVRDALVQGRRTPFSLVPAGWDGKTAHRIVAALEAATKGAIELRRPGLV